MQRKSMMHPNPSLSVTKYKFAQSFAQSWLIIKGKEVILLALLKKLPLVFISYSMINIYEFFLLGEVRLFLIDSRE